ncbi:MAG: glycosyltransferase family 4 protein [Lachnospiraceae bacterium]|nr:glycosyltransferase family 4 protein [Lachnospiraceae bacterium]
MRHILIVSQYFFPESFRINDVAKEWVKRGNKVTVVTGIPNYPQGQYFEGYDKKNRRRETWEGVDIIRLPIRPRKSGSWNLAVNYLSFVFQGRKWIKQTNIKADIVFTYEVSPMTQALIGVWYAQKCKIPHILHVTDLWPENVEIITGIHSKFVLAPIQWMVDYIYKRSARILTSSRSFIDAVKCRGVLESKIDFWPHYAEDFYQPLEREPLPDFSDDGSFNVVFAGNIGYAQGLGLLPEVAIRLREKNKRVHFTIIGDGRFKSELERMIHEKNLEDYFVILGRKPAEEIPKYLAYADALLISLSRSKVFSITIPAKTQSCLACGKPVLVSADGEVQDIIIEANAGLASAAEDASGLTENIVRMIDMPQGELHLMGENALKYSKINFGKNELLDKLDRIMDEEIENV